MTDFNKGGRPPLIDRCDHCVKVRFNNSEWDELTRMMERADMTVKATFIKQLIFGKPFKVLTSDKNLSVYCAKLSEFFAQYRMIGVNYDLVVKTLRVIVVGRLFVEKYPCNESYYWLSKPRDAYITSLPVQPVSSL